MLVDALALRLTEGYAAAAPALQHALALEHPDAWGEQRERSCRLLLLDEDALSNGRLELVLATPLDESEQRLTRDAGRRVAAPASRYR